MGKGVLITLEGGEGAGKTKAKQALELVLPLGTVFAREPGGTRFSEEVRKFIKSDLCKEAGGLAELFLFMAARANLVDHVVTPALEAGRIVILDRYLASTFAYQIWAPRNFCLREIFDATTKVFPKPDLNIHLNLDPEIGLHRAEAAGNTDHIHDRGIEYHRRVQQGYSAFWTEYASDSHAVIDAEQAEEKVAADVVRTVQLFLKEKAA